MSLNQFKENECVLTTQKHCPCVEFLLADTEAARQHRHGFHTSQLLHYRLEPDDGGDGDREPAEKLTLAFATADVVIVGWRLERLAEHLVTAICSPCALFPPVTPTWIGTKLTSPGLPSSRSPKIDAHELSVVVGPHGGNSSALFEEELIRITLTGLL